jgi:hypothetical protein
MSSTAQEISWRLVHVVGEVLTFAAFPLLIVANARRSFLLLAVAVLSVAVGLMIAVLSDRITPRPTSPAMAEIKTLQAEIEQLEATFAAPEFTGTREATESA